MSAPLPALHRSQALLLLMAASMFAAPGCGRESVTAQHMASPPVKRVVEVTPRDQQLKHFPCLECHNKISDDNRSGIRPAVHRDIRMAHFGVADADGQVQSTVCSTCHALDDIEHLRRLHEAPVSFTDSHLQCGQCHHDKLRDWKLGIHSKQVGSWNSTTEHRLTCVECHDPHHPSLQAMPALPPPVRPKLGVAKTPHGGHGSHNPHEGDGHD